MTIENCDGFLSLGNVVLNRSQCGFYIVIGEISSTRVIIWWCGTQRFDISHRDVFRSVETKF